jgi:RimJ/RimL family protein N-acetyltransferase
MHEGMVLETFRAGGMETVFRCPCAGDLDAFIEMHRQLAREQVMARRLTLDRESGSRLLAEILASVSEGRRAYLLVEQGGFLVGEGFTASCSGRGYCEVGLALVRRARGLGIGTRMMRALEREAGRMGFRRLFLTVWSANPAALHVYAKAGYRECGRRPGWILTDSGEVCDLVEMHKPVTCGDG